MKRTRLACSLASIALLSAASFAQTNQDPQAVIDALSPQVATLLSSSNPGSADIAADALIAAWHESANGADFHALQSAVDNALAANHAPPKDALIEVFRVTNQAKYRKALDAMGAKTVAEATGDFETAFDERMATFHTGKLSGDAIVSLQLIAATRKVAVRDAAIGRGRKVVVDAWFNSQTRPDYNGKTELFHYKWADDQNSGFRFFGRAFQRYGATLATLPDAPTAANLKGASVYVIPSPDIPAKNPNPHYMDKASGDAIEAWVKDGGVLLLMENDKANSEFEHFNTLSERFGIHFNPVLRNTVEGNHYEQGRLDIPAGTGDIFPTALPVYMKEICTITVSGPAKSIYTDKGDTLMAIAHIGKGTVYAVVDPWLYNEYTDGRKLPADYKNFDAALAIAKWSLQQPK